MAEAGPRRAPPGGAWPELVLAALFLLLAVLVTPLLASGSMLGLGIAGGALVATGAALRPVWAVAGFCAVDPFIAGVDRGQIVPYLRLNEALLVPLLAGVAVALLIRGRGVWGRHAGPALHGLDVVVFAVAFTGSVTTLLWMYWQGRQITSDDLQYAVTMWKYVALYAMTRLAVREPDVARPVLAAVVVSAALLGAIGILQALGIGPVIHVLSELTPADPSAGYSYTAHRAMGTLGNPIAFGDVMIYAAVIAAAAALRMPHRRTLLWALAGGLALAALASGQVSIGLGLLVSVITFAVVSGAWGKVALAGAGLLAVAVTVLQPVLGARLDAQDPSTGLPTSWTGPYGRLENLETYFWPHIGENFNWLLGVRTAGRAPGNEWWRPWVYIESGYTWVVWTGGILMLGAVLALIVIALRTGRRMSHLQEPTTSAMGVTLTTVTCAMAVLLFFDPHLTLRGGGEFFFVIVALAVSLDMAARRRPADNPSEPAPPHAGPGTGAPREAV